MNLSKLKDEVRLEHEMPIVFASWYYLFSFRPFLFRNLGILDSGIVDLYGQKVYFFMN